MDRDARRWKVLQEVRHAREKRELEARLRAEFEAKLAARERSLRDSHKREIGKLKEAVDEIIRKASRVGFDRVEGNRYSLRIDFDAGFMGGYSRSEELQLIAERVAYQVEREIASTRFVQSAYELERERYSSPRYWCG